jgi:hypothetical protein
VGGARIDMGAVEMAALLPVQGLTGDYNRDAVVGAGDFVLWRKTNGTSVATAYDGADGDGNSIINQNDYTVWRSNFGKPAPGSGAQMLLWSTATEASEPDLQLHVNGGAAEAHALATDSALELLVVIQEGGAPTHIQSSGITADDAGRESSNASDVAGELSVMWESV